MTRRPRLVDSQPDWMTRPLTWEEIRDALGEAWVSWRSRGRVNAGPTFEDRRDAHVPAEFRDELWVAPANMIAACMWSGDPYGESAHPEFLAKTINTLERFRAGGLLTSEPQFAVNGRDFGPEYALYRLVAWP